MEVWVIDTEEDGRITLIAPNGLHLFTVPPEIADMIGRMLIDEAEPEE